MLGPFPTIFKTTYLLKLDLIKQKIAMGPPKSNKHIDIGIKCIIQM